MWEDTISPYVVEDWESSTGIPLKATHFDNDDERNLLMMKSLQLPFDVSDFRQCLSPDLRPFWGF